MAGEPITSKPFLSAATQSDLSYIVDVSDTSESPEGTSKHTSIEVQNEAMLFNKLSDVNIPSYSGKAGQALVVNDAETGVESKPFGSGTWTPVASGVTSSATITCNDGYYIRVGNVVTCSFNMEVVLDAGASSTTFFINPPIASDFANSRQAWSSNLMTINLSSIIIASNSTENKFAFDVIGTANGDSIQNLAVTITYLIV